MAAINELRKDDIDQFDNKIYLNGSDLDMYQSIASGSAIYPGSGTPLGLVYCALKLNGEAGELAEHVGKAMRDDKLIEAVFPEDVPADCFSSNTLTSERRELILKEIGDCLWYLSALCHELDTSLSIVALMNLRKLYDRQQRNKLQGSGDER